MKLPAYPRAKPSGVEWLGDLPEHWEVKRGRFAMRVNPSAPRLRALKPEHEVSFVPMDAVGVGGGLSLEQTRILAEVSSGYTEFQDGDVVVAKITPCFENGKAALANGLVNGAAYGTTELHVLRAGPTLDRSFLFYVALSDTFRKLGESEMYGAGGQKRVPPEFNKDFRTPLPPASEQRAIAAFLDRETGRVDRLVAKKRELIERLKEKRTALISRTVTRGLPPAAARAAGLPENPPLKPSGVEWLGEIPKHWEVKRLLYLFRFSSGGTPPTETAEYWSGDLPWVSPKDMKSFHLSDTIDHVSELALKETSTTAVLPETMLLVARSGILKHSIPVAITTRRMTINQDIKGVTPLRKDASVYYYAWFIEGHQSALLTEWRKEGATVESLELERVKNCTLPFPPLPEQAAIAAYLDEETAKLDALVGKVEEAVERLQEYRTALITAAVTGKIDVQKASA